MTVKFLKAGLIGDHIQKTRLPAALKLMCDDAGIKLDFSLIDTSEINGFDFVSRVNELMTQGWSGVTVTHPYKIAARNFAGSNMLKELSHLNASNTLRFDAGLEAFNTDYTGFLSAWSNCMGARSPGKVAMAGAGGVASALGPALAKLGATKISIWDLDHGKAAKLAGEIGLVAESIPLEQAKQAAIDADGLVNATALGMQQYPGSAFEQCWILGQKWAFDAVYTPVETQFLSFAMSAGLKTISGFELFKHMAIASFSAYTNRAVDEEVVLARLEILKPTA
ncbi:MAG: shikimate dehydrogenase [Hyphomicrobiales bacterium]